MQAQLDNITLTGIKVDAKIKKRLIKDSIGVLFWKFAGAIGLLAFYSVSAHAMSTSEFGQLSYLVALGMIASVLANGGLQRDAVRIGEASYRNASSSIFVKDMLNASTYILLMFTLVGIVVWTLSTTGILVSMELTVLIITLGFIFARAYALFFGEIIRGLHNGRTGTAIQQSIPYLIASAAIVVWMQFSVEQDASTVLLSLTGGTIVALMVGMWALRKATCVMQGEGKAEVDFRFKLLAPFVFTDFLLAMQQQGHVMILAGVTESDEVGLFSAAFRAATLIALPLSVVNASIPSTIAEQLSANNKEKLSRILIQTSSLSLIVAVVICVPLLIFSEELLSLIFGKEYMEASTAFRIMLIAQILNVWTGSPGKVIMIAQKSKALFFITIPSVMGGLLLTYYAGTHYGSVGAAMGAFFSLVVHNTIMAIYCAKILKVHCHATAKGIREIGSIFIGKVS